MRDTGHPMLAIPAAGQASCGLVDAHFKTEKIRISCVTPGSTDIRLYPQLLDVFRAISFHPEPITPG
jgi:hypothetical protein